MEALTHSKSEFGELGGADFSLSVRLLKYNLACRMHALPSPDSLLCTVFSFPIIFWVIGRSTTTPNCHFPGCPPHPQPPAALPNPPHHHSYLHPALQLPEHYWCPRLSTWPKFVGSQDKVWCDQDHRPFCCRFHPFWDGMLGRAPRVSWVAQLRASFPNPLLRYHLVLSWATVRSIGLGPTGVETVAALGGRKWAPRFTGVAVMAGCEVICSENSPTISIVSANVTGVAGSSFCCMQAEEMIWLTIPAGSFEQYS